MLSFPIDIILLKKNIQNFCTYILTNITKSCKYFQFKNFVFYFHSKLITNKKVICCFDENLFYVTSRFSRSLFDTKKSCGLVFKM